MNRELGSLTAAQAGALRPEAILVMATGSYEQHGPHLPISTDLVLADEHARRVVQQWGDHYDLWLLPSAPFGLALEHAWSPGTISMPADRYIQWTLAHCGQLTAAAGARNLLIVNGHGGNRAVLQVLVQEIRHRTNLTACVTHPASMTGTSTGDVFPDIHAGLGETSVMLAAAPHLVALGKLDGAYSRAGIDPGAVREHITDRAVTWPWTSADSWLGSGGIIGDPAQATAQRGEAMFAEAVRRHRPVLSQLLNMHRERHHHDQTDQPRQEKVPP